jgi:AcrR family transcriptional regulator
VRLAASQVIERPPAEVFRFVATDHLQNHPKWDPAITSITQTSPGPMGVGATARLVRTDRGRRVEGTIEVTEYQPVSSFTEVSRFGPLTLHARATFEPVAPASTRLELVIDTHGRGVIRLLLPVMRGTFRKTMARSLRSIKEQVEGPPRRPPPDPLEAQWDLWHAIYGTVAQDTAPASSYSSSGAARPGKRTSGWAARGASCLTQLG